MRGRHQAHVHLDRLRAAEALELLLLQHAQQLGLQLRRDVADLVEEQRPLVRQLEAADLLAFNTATALFGGTAPLLATYLVERTGDPCSPDLYIMLSAAVTMGVVCLICETYREPLR